MTTFTQRLDTETIESVSCSIYTTWAVTTDGKLFGCGDNAYKQQGDGTTTDVKSFTQRGPPGSVNIPVVQQLSPQVINPIPLSPLTPITPVPAILMNVTPADITGTDYTFHMGGKDWMLCTVSTGVDQYALALYYAGLTEPLLWDEDVTLTFSNGTLTVSNGGNSYTMTYESIYYKGNGNYVIMGDSAYIRTDTEIIAFSIPTTDSGVEVSGTYDSVSALSISDGSITLGDASVTVTDTDHDTIKTLSGVGYTYDTDQTGTCTSIIVPKKVSYTETVEDAVMDNLLSVIPIVMIVGLILGTIASFIYIGKR